MHFKHLDFLWVIVRAMCITIYWYNPFVWIAGYLSQQDSELACDEAVISYLGESERKMYGKALMDVVVRKSNHMIFSTQITRGKKEMKKRIKFILKKPKKYLLNSLICIICLFMICACTLTSQNQNILNINSDDDYLELVKGIMPDFISNELKCVNKEDGIVSVSDVLDNPTLKFDIYLSGDGISYFLCDIDYYILLQSIDSSVDEDKAKDIVNRFAEKFINYDIELTLNENLNSDEAYVFLDQYGSFYMVNKLYGYLSEYDYQSQTIELTDNQKNELLNDLKAVMPDVIVDEINSNGYFYTYDDQNVISIANAKEDPTLRLDFVFDEEDKLIQYVSKEYGFVENLGYHDILYSDSYYEAIVKKFSQVFLDREVTLTQISLPSHYDGYDNYRAYKDQYGGEYVINMGIEMVVNYEA